MVCERGVEIDIGDRLTVITLIKGGVYDDLNLSVGDALLKRSDVRPHFSQQPLFIFVFFFLDFFFMTLDQQLTES
jgi:hypothetical protein